VLPPQGPESAAEFIAAFAASPAQLSGAGEWWRVALSLLGQPSAPGLGLCVYGLATVAPEVEAVMG
jgi:hypothetical protein